MPDIVFIPTAGIGSRMGCLTKNINKALLPYRDKPALSHIIDSFPADSHFIIPVGYRGDQIRDFLKLAYQDRNITLVEIGDFSSKNSGTAKTILECKHLLKSAFWYVSCDTIFDNQDLGNTDISEDICWVSSVSKNDSIRYTMFGIDNSRISEISFKEEKDQDWVAFTGLMRIAEPKSFIERIEKSGSAEFIHAISPGTPVRKLKSWIDIGTKELYDLATKKQGFDFSKTNEYTWICNGSVVKWWNDMDIPRKKVEKAMANANAVPKNIRTSGSMMSYDYAAGKTMYQSPDADIGKMLSWLKDTVWKKSDKDITKDCLLFYRNKTQQRISQILENHERYPVVNSVNSRKVRNPREYLEMIDWDELAKNHVSSWIHGDLQFDNVVIQDNNGFLAIDWRHEFGNSIDIGDAYYDLSKLMGGCILDYSRIKANDFGIEFNEKNVKITYPSVVDADEKIMRIKSFSEENGFDGRKLDVLVPLIFWNMAPLHNGPFDLLLWYLGILKFSEIFDHEKIH